MKGAPEGELYQPKRGEGGEDATAPSSASGVKPVQDILAKFNPGVEGQEFRKVTLPPESHRGGFLTMAGVLKVTANGTYTSPVGRGVWVLERILGAPPPPPPDGVSAIVPSIGTGAIVTALPAPQPWAQGRITPP